MRRWVIEQSLASNVGHVGSALSIVEIVTVLWEEVMRDAGSERPDRDRFILAKGHAALVLYCALRLKGILDPATLETYCSDGSLLSVHPERVLPTRLAGGGCLDGVARAGAFDRLRSRTGPSTEGPGLPRLRSAQRRGM